MHPKAILFFAYGNKRVDQYQQTAMKAGIQQQQQREGFELLLVFIKARRPKFFFVFIGSNFIVPPDTAGVGRN